MTDIWWAPEDTETRRQVEDRGLDVIRSAADVLESLRGRKMMLRSLKQGISGANVFNVNPSLDGVPEVEGVLKIGPAGLLVTEIKNYRKWVKSYLEDHSSFAPAECGTVLDALAAGSVDAAAAATDVVAIYYRRVGEMTFGEYIAHCLARGQVAAACDAIERLLSILRPWQEKMSADNTWPLTAGSVYAFNPGPVFDEFEAVCKRLSPNTALDWVDVVRDFWSGPGLRPCRMLKTVLHGDLHTENVMVGDDGRRLTLIDFGSCVEGHFLRDVCTLETHLVVRALVPDNDNDMDAYLEELKELYDPALLADPFARSASTPLSAVASRLRRYAFACLMNGNSEYAVQYAFAVLRHAVRIAIRDDSETSDRQRLAALCVAQSLSTAITVVDGRLRLTAEPARRHEGLGFLRGADANWQQHGVRASVAGVCSDDMWAVLADKMLSAQHVDVFGLVPIALLNELLTLAPNVAQQTRSMYLNYVTTEPGGRGDTGLAYAHPRWRGSLTGMRNLIESLSSSTSIRQGLTLSATINQTNRVSDNCLIRVQPEGPVQPTIFEITRLSEAERHSQVRFVVNVIDDADGSIAHWMDQTPQHADSIIMREVVCDPLGGDGDSPQVDDDGLPSLTMRALVPYGSKVLIPSGLRPIALTILRGPRGRQILMKKRNPLADYDNFGKYSFLSTRILAEDLARAGGVSHLPKEDLDDDFTQLWDKLAGDDDGPWHLDKSVFLVAAQRDVHACTRLDLDQGRFRLQGTKRIDTHASGIQTCFIVFLVDLTFDELEAARASSNAMLEGVVQTMELVNIPNIFDESIEVNQFTKHHGDWLRQVCTSSPHQRA